MTAKTAPTTEPSLTPSDRRSGCVSRAWYVGGAVGVVLVGAALHLAKLASLPHGLFHDEAYNLLDEATISWSHVPVFFPANQGREGFFFYWQHLFVWALGTTTFATRLPAAYLSIVSLALEVAVMGRFFGRRVGVMAGAILAGLYFFVQDGRVGLRFTTLPSLVLVAMLSLWWAVQQRRVRAFAPAGLAMGIGAYTYIAARMLPVVALVFTAYALTTRPKAWRTWIGGIILAGLITAAIAAPLAVAILGSGGVTRLQETTVVRLDQPLGRNAAALAANAWTYVRSYSVLGDVQWLSNIRGRPVFDPIMTVWFYAGFAVLCFVVVRPIGPGERDAAVICLVTFLAMYVPGLLSTEAPYFQRVFGTVPIVALAPALAMDRLCRLAPRGRWRLAAGSVATLSLTWQIVLTTHDYFVTFATARESAFDLGSGATAIAEYLVAAQPRGALFISTFDDVVPKALAPTETARAHWFHAREILPFPVDASSDSYYLFDFTDPSPLEAALRPLATPVLVAVDHNVGIEVAHGYRVSAVQSLDSLLPNGPAATFDHALTITGARVIEEPAPLGTIGLELGLRAERDSPGYLSMSIRLVDDAGNTWARRNGVGTDLSQWKAGQEALILQRLLLPTGTPPGVLHAIAQVYQVASLAALDRDDGKGKDLAIGDVTLTETVTDQAALPATVRPLNALLARFVLLRGFEVSGETVRQGDVWRAGVIWRCEAQASAGTYLDFVLTDSQGRPLGTMVRGKGLSAPGPDGCAAGTTAFDRRIVAVGTRWPVGPAELHVVLRDASGATIADSTAAHITVQPLPRSTAVPKLGTSQNVSFADSVRLLGVSKTESPPGATTVDLVWQADGEPQHDRTVFVHLLGPDGAVLAQHDGPPAEGRWPLTAWTAGQVIDDPHTLAIAPDSVPAGSVLEIGLYDPANGDRLGVVRAGAIPVQDRAIRVPLADIGP